MKRKAHTIAFKGDKSDEAALVAALAALLHSRYPDGIRIERHELSAIDGAIGIRARYEDDGAMAIWTYARIPGEN